ncbi:MAG: AEC family transporter [Massiliimalia sp.]|jgi:predicted permease
MVWSAIQSVLSLCILMGCGYWMAGKSWFTQTSSDLLSKLTVTIAIPCYMFYNVLETCETPQKLKELVVQLPIPFCTILFSLALGIVLALGFRVSKGKRGVFLNAVTFSNTVIIGFPVVESLFGAEGLPSAMIYYMANTILFWTVGTWLLRNDGPQKSPFFSLSSLKKIISPPIIGFLTGTVFVLLQIPIPEFIWTPITMLKQVTTPIAMLFIGSILRQTNLKQEGFGRELWIVLAVRFCISPICMIFICRMLPIPLLLKQVFFVLSTMPAMTQLGIMSKESQSDYRFASVLVAVTSAVSMVTIPIYMFFLSQFQLLG